MKSIKITISRKKNIKINYKNKSYSLLNILEKNKIQTKYNCRNGFCGICKIYLNKGKIFYFKKPIAFFEKKEILPCICIPVTNINIKIT